MNNPFSAFKGLRRFYHVGEILKSAVTGILFFLFPLSLLLAISINLMIIYSRIYVPFYTITLLITIYLGIYASGRFIETLKNYRNTEEIDYKTLHLQLSMTVSILITLVYTIVFNFL